VIYGFSEDRLKRITGNHPETPTLALTCRTAFASVQRHVEVIGSCLEEETVKGFRMRFNVFVEIEKGCENHIPFIHNNNTVSF